MFEENENENGLAAEREIKNTEIKIVRTLEPLAFAHICVSGTIDNVDNKVLCGVDFAGNGGDSSASYTVDPTTLVLDKLNAELSTLQNDLASLKEDYKKIKTMLEPETPCRPSLPYIPKANLFVNPYKSVDITIRTSNSPEKAEQINSTDASSYDLAMELIEV